MTLVIRILLWFSALGCGLIGGLYFAFSAFAMTALGSIDRPAGISAMNAINVVILKSLFIPIFFGTTVTSLALAILAIVRWGQPGAMSMLAGGLIYVIGMTVVTMLYNVPLNNALAAVGPTGSDAASVWTRYLTDWTMWNHARTISSVVASALFILALVSLERTTPAP